MMLSEAEANRVWERMFGAEVRSLYFGDLASRYTKYKQFLTGISFFFSSAAAASIAAGSHWIPLIMSVISALAGAYSIAAGLDRKAATMAKLHSGWYELATDYEKLWNHWRADDAEVSYAELVSRERDFSQMATTEAPNDQKLLGKYQDVVLKQHHIGTSA
jgi:hypothetical protein